MNENRIITEKKIYISSLITGYMEEKKEITSLIDAVRAVEEGLGMLKAYDHYTYTHCINVGILANEIGSELEFDSESMTILTVAATLHDIGKMGVSDAVLNKEGPLDEKEWDVMKKHPVMGKSILEGLFPLLDTRIIKAVGGHHERCDGSGYPKGTAGADVFSEIIAVADVFDAMTHNRPYHKGCSAMEAFETMLADSGLRNEYVKILMTALEKVEKAG